MNSQSPVNVAWRYFWPRSTHPRTTDHSLVRKIRDEAEELKNVTNKALAQRTTELRRQVQKDRAITSADILVTVFAMVVEAAKRVLGVNLYDVQLLGGLALARGEIAELQTGEGKTFAAMLPASLHALAGSGVHVMTVNAYLAGRDYELLAPVYRLLGHSVGLVDAESDTSAKRAAYACDINYGPGYEFGFDYLRDQVALLSRRKPRLGEAILTRLHCGTINKLEPMQRGHAVAIVDEADSVLLDEATTPLILSAGGNAPANNAEVYFAAAQVSAECELDRHFVLDEAAATLRLTQQALDQIAAEGGRTPRSGLDRPWQVYVEQALRAKCLLHRDVDYVVQDDSILLVDQYTGRIFADRSWREGLQQAVQAKEGVTITTETSSIARITRQRYFRLYRHLCGMTGTARGAERELHNVYGLGVAIIPPNKPCHRKTLSTRVFAHRATKEEAIVKEIIRLHRIGQPVLVGSASIETSQRLAHLLDERGLHYQLLNGKQDCGEAEIVARAGDMGTITIATNMAGRGTDIKLGVGVAQRGGLHVIATEPQESTRVDRQLVGRAARQGDPGSCQLFASSDDSLFTLHASALSARIRRLAGGCGEVSVELSRDIARVQKSVERKRAYESRQLFAHDDWLETVLRDLTVVT